MNLHSYSDDRQRNMKKGLLEMVTTTVWIKERDQGKVNSGSRQSYSLLLCLSIMYNL